MSNPYESPAVEEYEFDTSGLSFCLFLLMFVLLIPVTFIAAWIGYKPERFAEYCFVVPLTFLLLVAGISCCLAVLRSHSK